MNKSYCEWSSLESSAFEDHLKNCLEIGHTQIKKYFNFQDRKRTIHPKEVLRVPLNLANFNRINPGYQGELITLLDETTDFLAVEKPSGMHGHPLNYDDHENVLSALLAQGHYWIENISSLKHEKALLYRLDSGTSGVLILAKNQNAFNEFEMIEKRYFALVEGKLQRQGSVEHYLSSRGKKGSLVIGVDQDVDKSKHVTLIILSSDYFKNSNTSLLEVKLVTGHRHQIRAQLSLLGHPIVGDTFYGARPNARIFLHAHQYSLIFNGRNYSFTSPMPKSFDSGSLHKK